MPSDSTSRNIVPLDPAKRVVLVADDTPAVHLLIRARLADESVDLLGAADGATALDMARKLRPDLILLDVDLPAIDGFGVCDRLKTDAATLDIPVIFLSGAIPSHQKLRGLHLGGIGFLVKPFDTADLRAAVRNALREKAMADLLAGRAMIDALTGLWNVHYFNRRLDQETSLARRTGDPLACLLIDIDGLDDVNRTCGRPAGNDLIQRVGELIGSSVRSEDIAARIDTGRFAIITPNTPAVAARPLGNRLCARAADIRITTHRVPIEVTLSVGIADALESRDAALRAARDALQAAKTANPAKVAVAGQRPAA